MKNVNDVNDVYTFKWKVTRNNSNSPIIKDVPLHLNPIYCCSPELLLVYVGDLLGKRVDEVTHNGGEYPVPPVLLGSMPEIMKVNTQYLQSSWVLCLK